MNHAEAKSFTILVVAATPERDGDRTSGPSELDSSREMRSIQEIVTTGDSVHIQVRFLPAATWQRLHDALLEHMPCVVHITARYDREHLELESDDRIVHSVPASDLIALLKTFRNAVRLIVYSACNSTQIAALSAETLNAYTIGFNGDVRPIRTQEFSQAFYRNLVSGVSVDESFARAVAVVPRALATLHRTEVTEREIFGETGHLPTPQPAKRWRWQKLVLSVTAVAASATFAGIRLSSPSQSEQSESPLVQVSLVLDDVDIEAPLESIQQDWRPVVEQPAGATIVSWDTSATNVLVVAVPADFSTLTLAFPRSGCGASRIILDAQQLLGNRNSPVAVTIPSCERQTRSCLVRPGAAEATVNKNRASIHMENAYRMDCVPVHCEEIRPFCKWMSCDAVNPSTTSAQCSGDKDLWPDKDPFRVAVAEHPRLAERFCAAQGGRLPTQEEWDYAYATSNDEVGAVRFASQQHQRGSEPLPWDLFLPWNEWVRSSSTSTTETTSLSYAWRRELAGSEPGRFPTGGDGVPVGSRDFSTWRCQYDVQSDTHKSEGI